MFLPQASTGLKSKSDTGIQTASGGRCRCSQASTSMFYCFVFFLNESVAIKVSVISVALCLKTI